MIVDDMPQVSRARLVQITEHALLIEAARLLTSGTDIVVVHDSDNVVRGVVTKTDVVRQMSLCQGASCRCPVSAVMSRDPLLCRGSDLLQDVSSQMKERHLKNIVVVDADDRASGLLTARAILRVLLGNAEEAEAQLVNYVGGVGYQ
jgi:signal-transduction protein with cAMP-binding, CBS, and nucleotidyltransferase domain